MEENIQGRQSRLNYRVVFPNR